MTLAAYVALGLLLWGLPAVIVIGPPAVGILVAAIAPIWLLAGRPDEASREETSPTSAGIVLVLVLTVVYLVGDAWIGRQKMSMNLFLQLTATESFVEAAEASVSQGRGVIDLLGATLIILPFALIDTARLVTPIMAVVLRVISLLYIFYDTGVSRGYLLIALLAVLLGSQVTKARLVFASSLALGGFFLASMARGDFAEVSFSNPLFDGVAWPFINLGLLDASGCDVQPAWNYLVEFGRKFLPGFLVPKEIYSFNIEMTRCIYPGFTEAIPSISIFTWMGEMVIYQPSLLTAAIAGILLGLLCRLIDRIVVRCDLVSLRIFTGLFCIVLLRSRVQDVLSALVLFLLFVLVWERAITAQWLTALHRTLTSRFTA